MKHLFFYIVCFLALFNRTAGALEPPQLPDDFEGKLTRQYIANYVEDDTYETTFLQNLNIYYEIGSYLYQKYPWEEIIQDDFIEKVRVFFPYDSEELLKKKHKYLINTASLYQMGRDLYVEIANKYLVPHAYRRVHDESEFDHPNEVSYIPTADDEYVKVYNFKKFLTYSNNSDELNAISDFKRNSEKNDDILTQIDRIAEKVDWKKVWLYGTVYQNPLFSELGIGESQRGDGVNVRLLARDTYTEGKKTLDYGIQIVTHARYFVLANNLDKKTLKPQLDFTGSENVADVEILYPLPQKTNALPQAHKYFGNFIIPLKVTPQKLDEGVTLHADINLSLCDYELNCRPQKFSLRLHSDVTGPDKFDNGFDNLFYNSLRRVPTAQQEFLTLRQFNVVDTPDGQQLFLEAATSKKIKSIEAYIENAEGFTQFAAPNYIVGDDAVKIYFKPLKNDENTDLSNTDYIVSLVLNNRIFYRDNLVPNIVSVPQKTNIPTTFKTVLYAFISGIMLNFLPCMAPFLLIIILMFIRLSHKKPEMLRRVVMSCIKGCGVGLLTAALIFIGQKYTGRDIIWGIQYDSTVPLIFLFFGFAALLKLLPNIQTYITDMAAADNRSIFFGCGLAGGIMFIFSVAPYLSLLMNVAVSVSALSALTILIPLTAGMAAIPLFVYCLLTKPQMQRRLFASQKDIAKLIYYTVWASLLYIWMFCAFLCGLPYALLLALITMVWMFICELYQKFLDYLDGALDESISVKQIQSFRRGSVVFMGIILILFLSGGIYLADHARSGRSVNSTSPQDITKIISERQDKPIMVIVGADWCFKCQINRWWTLNPLMLEQWQDRYDMEIVRVSQTPYVAQYMRENEQYDLPFYILYTRQYPQGIVLDSDVKAENMELLLN